MPTIGLIKGGPESAQLAPFLLLLVSHPHCFPHKQGAHPGPLTLNLFQPLLLSVDFLKIFFIKILFSAKDDGIDLDALAAEIEGAGASKEPKGKKKKKGAKKDDYE